MQLTIMTAIYNPQKQLKTLIYEHYQTIYAGQIHCRFEIKFDQKHLANPHSRVK